MEVIEYSQNNPHIVVIGFRHSGFHQALGILSHDNNLLTYSDDSFAYTDHNKSEWIAWRIASVPLLGHNVHIETDSEASVVEIASSD